MKSPVGKRRFFISHLTDDNRKTISNMISHKATCKELADLHCLTKFIHSASV